MSDIKKSDVENMVNQITGPKKTSDVSEYKLGDMTVIVGRPPVWENIVQTFQIEPRYALFTYGHVIFNPEHANITDDLLAHERWHVGQQATMAEQGDIVKGARLWWGKYLRDPEFRIEQELEAYAVQYEEFCRMQHDRNKQAKMFQAIVGSLSGTLYGKMMTRDEAEKKLTALFK